MSAKVGIPTGIFNFLQFSRGKKKFPRDFQKFPWENIPLEWKGKKIPWEKLSKLRYYSFCKEIIPF